MVQKVKTDVEKNQEEIWSLIRAITRLNSWISDLNISDLENIDEKLEQIKTKTFGLMLFISDPGHNPKLRDSVVSVSLDGTLHCER